MSYPVYENLVLEGGGVRGMAYVGAVKVLEEKGILKNIKRFAGSSAGAIMAGALAIGYTADELQKIMQETNFSTFMDDTTGYFRDIYRLFKHYGIYRGSTFYDWYGKVLEKKTGKADITFKEVYDTYGSTLVITGTCLNKKEVHYYHHLTNPNLEVRKAVRISMSIPIFFKAVTWGGDTLVDGGVLDNYPMHVFDSHQLPDSKNKSIRPMAPNPATLGLKLLEPKEFQGVGTGQVIQTNNNVDSLTDFLKTLMSTWMAHIENMYIESGYWERTIPISTSGIPTTKFDLTKEEQDTLYENGVNSVEMKLTSLVQAKGD